MDEKQQKILLAVLGVLALGAGSWFVFFRDSGNQVKDEGSDVVLTIDRSKNTSNKPSSGALKVERRTRTSSKPVILDRERSDANTTVLRRRSGSRRTINVRKKEDLPPG